MTPQQYRVLREKATELPFSGKLLYNKDDGVYSCAACGTPLFSSRAKFDSGTGWPSFFQPVSSKSIVEKPEGGFLTRRVEVSCAKCGGHLGHVFEDGPKPTGLRYCINSLSLEFKAEKPRSGRSR